MPYATVADMIDRFGQQVLIQLTDFESLGVVDQDTLDAAIADSDSVIDGYVGQRYALPLPGTPALLTGISCDLAFYRLHRHGAPEEARRARDEALKLLERIASGDLLLEIAGVEPTSAGGSADFEGPDRVFSRDKMEGF